MLALLTGLVGVFIALDLFVFYVFFEVMLIPMYFIIGIWGGTNRLYAAIKFFIYTMAGSLLMLVAIVVMAWKIGAATGTLSFSYEHLLENAGSLGPAAPWLFAAFALAFAIKVPIFPLHTWLPMRTSRRRPREACSWPPHAQDRHLRLSPLRRAVLSPRWPSRLR